MPVVAGLMLLFGVFAAGCYEAERSRFAPSNERGEYGRIYLIEGDGMEVRWLTRNPRVIAASFEELLESMGGRLPVDSQHISAASLVLDFLGDQGWEMVSHTQTAHGGRWYNPEVWTFKRRR